MKSLPQEQMIFKKVGLSEKKVLFRNVASLRTPVFIKAEDEAVFQLLAVQNEKDEVLLCHHTPTSQGQEKMQKVMANFSYDNERYFFRTEISFTHGWVMLQLNEVDLYKLQRRANVRIDIPAKYDARVVIASHNGKACFVEARLLDLSAGGMKLQIPETLSLQNEDKLKGILHLGSRRPFELDIEVRHVLKTEEKGQVKQLAGVQFVQMSTSLESRLLSTMMDLQRELFLKYSK